jgi:hypothetical protein
MLVYASMLEHDIRYRYMQKIWPDNVKHEEALGKQRVVLFKMNVEVRPNRKLDWRVNTRKFLLDVHTPERLYPVNATVNVAFADEI